MFSLGRSSLFALLLSVAPLLHSQSNSAAVGADISLDGNWETGINRVYTATTPVPGLAQDTSRPSPGTLWYKRSIRLPAGNWQQASLLLNGARFAPEVYVNGEKVSSVEGGMAPTLHLLRSAAVAPGKTIQLEIALRSLNDLSLFDASAVPGADRWRTNVSSGLWDSVNLHLYGSSRLARITPFTDFNADSVSVHWQGDGKLLPGEAVSASIEDEAGKVLVSSHAVVISRLSGKIDMPLHHAVLPWSPEHPHVYRLVVALMADGKQQDVSRVAWGLKDFHTQDKRFYLNNQPIELRGGTVVWQRFLRNPEAAQIAFDSDWFDKNIMLRLKGYGANTLRFHLGLPPEKFLDLCDRDGLMVQMEWPFFHGVKASVPSMEEQWTNWLDVAMRHPSVMIVHGWNETGGNELKAAWAAMDGALATYPKLVVAHRDTLHIHKYWWSLFENLGLYYDSADQFDRTIMVDEFGGNYLDQNANPGGYPTTKETFLRFLGREQTPEGRLEFHAESNARVGEYWRRIGAAGILPFCILGGPQDGSSWFLGALHDPKPMPVWDALTAMFSPQSLSLDVWDRNYPVSQRVVLPLYFFNDTDSATALSAKVQIVSTAGALQGMAKTVSATVPPHGRLHVPVTFDLPATVGDWQFVATLNNKVPGVIHPIVSAWNFRTLTPIVSTALAQARVGVPKDETELRAFLRQNHITPVAWNDPGAQLLMTSSRTWAKLTPSLRQSMQDAVHHGVSVIMLDAGPQDLGQGYRVGDLGPLDGVPTVDAATATSKTQELFDGVKVTFTQVAEPESHVQPGPEDSSLWNHLPRSATWLWDGLRGGLVAPAASMEITGVSAEGFLTQWTGHGADRAAIAAGPYYSYQLAGYYAFSNEPDDKATIQALRTRVKFLAEDAPALQAVINPDSPIEQIDLNHAYRDAGSGQAQQLIRLSTCGKNLTRTDVAALTFGEGKGILILSQALTAGRLAAGSSEPGFYGLRHDPAAEQFVLNMLEKSLALTSPQASVR